MAAKKQNIRLKCFTYLQKVVSRECVTSILKSYDQKKYYNERKKCAKISKLNTGMNFDIIHIAFPHNVHIWNFKNIVAKNIFVNASHLRQ